MLRATFNNTPQMGVRAIGGTSVGQYWPAVKSPQNVGLYWLRGFNNQDVSLPNGINRETALQMPINTGGRVEATLKGLTTLTGDVYGVGAMSATLIGEGDISPGANTAAMGYATFPGETTLTGDLTAKGKMSATLDAGARPSAFDIAQEIVGTSADGSVTIGQAFKLLLAVLVGKVSGAGGSTITFRDVDDTKNRVVANVDANGNRTAVTKDVS